MNEESNPQPIGDRLLLENDRIRVWEDIVAPGLEQEVHTHTSPYVSVMVTPAHGEIVDQEGTVLYKVERDAGETRWFGPDRIPFTHTLRNLGNNDIRVVVIEVLDQ